MSQTIIEYQRKASFTAEVGVSLTSAVGEYAVNFKTVSMLSFLLYSSLSPLYGNL